MTEETIDDVKQAYALLFKAHGAVVKERDELASRFRELEAKPAQDAVDADTVEVYGVKDGKETLLGTAPTPPRMKAREIAREMFGPFQDDDASDAEMCFAALEQMIDYMAKLNDRAAISAKKGQP